MDGLNMHYAEWNGQRKTNTVWHHLHVESKKQNKLVNITTTTKKTDSDLENKPVVISRAKGMRRGKTGIGD